LCAAGCKDSGDAANAAEQGNAEAVEKVSDKQNVPEEDIKADEEIKTNETESGGDQKGEDDLVATADEMAEPVNVVDDSMTPVRAGDLKDGVYPVEVESSSTMFRIVSCELTVADNQMTALMTMGGTGYLYLYMGTGKEAVAASEKEYIPYEELAMGEHTFTVPVEALDLAIDCAAFSKNKEKWYDRVLVFRADSLPAEAFEEAIRDVTTASDLGLEDGEYTVNVTLEGGSGKASVESPAKITVENGAVYATIVWSSKNYDYMLVDDVRYDNENPEDNSTFVIPVAGFDAKLPVVGDTTAMSTPHEIDYTLFFESSGIEKVE